MIKLLPLFCLLLACASKKSIDQVSSPVPPVIKRISVASTAEAKKYIQNQRNFLVLLFEQSRDPYYGTPKWSEDCLKQNQIGDIRETETYIALQAKLILRYMEPGYCATDGRNKPGVQFIYFCKNTNEVVNLRFLTNKDFNSEDYDLCQ